MCVFVFLIWIMAKKFGFLCNIFFVVVNLQDLPFGSDWATLFFCDSDVDWSLAETQMLCKIYLHMNSSLVRTFLFLRLFIDRIDFPSGELITDGFGLFFLSILIFFYLLWSSSFNLIIYVIFKSCFSVCDAYSSVFLLTLYFFFFTLTLNIFVGSLAWFVVLSIAEGYGTLATHVK